MSFLFQQSTEREAIGSGGAVSEHHCRAGSQRPEQFQYGDIETERGDRQPAIRVTDSRLADHAEQEVHDRAMGDGDAFRLAGRAGRVDDVSKAVCLNQHIGRRVGPRIALPLLLTIALVQANAFDIESCSNARQVRLADQDACAAIFEHVTQAVSRKIRIERHIGAAGFEYAE